jgi:hypothetical protein
VVQDALASWLLPGTGDLAKTRQGDVPPLRTADATDAHAAFQIGGFRCDARAWRNGSGQWCGHVDICPIGADTVVARVRLEAQHPSSALFLDAARRAAQEGVEMLSRHANLPASLPFDLRVGSRS